MRPALTPFFTIRRIPTAALFLLSLAGSFCVGSLPAEESLSFHADYDGSATATVCRSGPSSPTLARGIRFVPGILGEAAFIPGGERLPYPRSPVLEYDAASHFNPRQGTISFWVQPDWDGQYYELSRMPCYFFFYACGGKETPDFTSRYFGPDSDYVRLSLWMWHWLRTDLRVGNTEKGKPKFTTMERRCRDDFLRGDWWHLALTWDENGWTRLYVNGRYTSSMMGGGKAVPVQARFHPKDVQRFYVGSLPFNWNSNSRADAAIDELKIFRRALSAEEIKQEYCRLAPLAVLVSRRYLRAGQPETVEVELSPTAKAGRVHGELRLTLTTRGGARIAAKKMKFSAESRKTIRLAVGELGPGEYRLTCRFEHGKAAWQRSVMLVAYQLEHPPQEASADDVKLGERVAFIDCARKGNNYQEKGAAQVRKTPIGAYLEAASSKANRFAFEVKLRAPSGHPHVVQITWPDDTERSMGLYMYPRSSRPLVREHLSGGIQAGGEYPNSGRMVRTRYLFWPMKEDYLFEARTMIESCPAAVQKVEIFRVDGPLPKLPIHSPPNRAARSIGLLDEDQTFQIHLRPEYFSSRFYPVRAFERLMEYMDYTGQNLLSYSLIRYTGQRYYSADSHEGHKTTLLKPGWVDLLLDLMSERDIQLLANVNLYSLPTMAPNNAERQATAARGALVIDRNGRTVSGWGHRGLANPVHPETRAVLLNVIGEMVRRFGSHPALRGIDIWLMFNSCPITWNSLDLGYGDFTVALFEKETGIPVPGNPGSPTRFAQRYRYLTGPKRQEWLHWRAEKTTGFFHDLNTLLRKTREDLELHVTIGHLLAEDVPGLGDDDFSFPGTLYEQRAIDLNALKQIPSVVLAPMRNTTMYRWLKHWYLGKETAVGEANFNVRLYEPFRNGPRSATALFYRYFESFNNSLVPDKYQARFQNADVKAHGRYFLQDYAVAVAAQDPAQILAGAQPLGTAGREAEAREFAQAFRALPAGNYLDLPGMGDPVCGRIATFGRDTFFYLCNLVASDLDVTLEFSRNNRPVKDLSSVREIPQQNKRVSLSLKPFQLRSFSVPGKRVEIVRATVRAPDALVQRGQAQLKKVRQMVARLKSLGAETRAYEARLQKVESLREANAFAEMHRYLYSSLFREIPGEMVKAEKGYLKEMASAIARSEYRVNCGSRKFYRAKSGKLFFPDQVWRRGGWGHDGQYKSVGRGKHDRRSTEDDELFQTEAYMLDAYRFTVKPGVYTVRLYMAVGYGPGAKPENFIFNIGAEGRIYLRDFDVFVEASGRAHSAVVREIKGIEVKDGILDIEFTESPKTPDASAKLCNAIEIIPQ